MKRYKRLREALKARGIDQLFLAQKLGRSISYVSSRFRGVDGWGDVSDYGVDRRAGRAPKRHLPARWDRQARSTKGGGQRNPIPPDTSGTVKKQSKTGEEK